MVFAGNPDNFLLNTPKHFQKKLFRLGTGASDTKKWIFFRRCLEIEGKTRYSLRET